MLEKGQKIHVITRRTFADDLMRHFVGEVIKCNEHTALAQGYAFVFMFGSGKFVRKPRMRQRVFGLTDSGFIITVIPSEVNLDEVVYETVDSQMVITDNKSFKLDIQEFAINL